jgi:hypothetical protein
MIGFGCLSLLKSPSKLESLKEFFVSKEFFIGFDSRIAVVIESFELFYCWSKSLEFSSRIEHFFA